MQDPTVADPAKARLLKRSFAVDVLVCPHCGGHRELLALIEHNPLCQHR